MHRLPVVLCGSLHTLHRTEAPAVPVLIPKSGAMTAWEVGMPRASCSGCSLPDPVGGSWLTYPSHLPGDCRGKPVPQLHATSQGKHPVRPLSHKNPPAKAPLLTTTSNLFRGKRQSLKQVALRAYIANPIF